MRRRHSLCALFIALVSATGCVTFYSKHFEPPGREGKEVYEQAQKDIYPNQIREIPEQFANRTLAWAGIVKDAQPMQSEYGPGVVVRIEHRYFDWIEDHGAQPELFFLSPRGEGEFVIIIKAKELHTQAELDQLVPKGAMAVAVGQVDVRFAKDKTRPLVLLTRHFHFQDRKKYRTDVFDYGRAGDPITRVTDGEFWKTYERK